MTHNTATPYVAVHVIIRKADKIVFLLRSGTGWGDGKYGLVSGKVEHDENVLMTAVREAREEAGIEVQPQDLVHILTAHRKSPDSTWVDICFEATSWSGEPHNAEPHKHSELVWLDPENLPENTVLSVRNYLSQIKAGNRYAEHGW